MSGLAEEELERSDASRWLRIAAGALVIAAAVAVVVYVLKGASGAAPSQKRQVTKIMLPDTPPPPPPPKEEPKPIKETKEVKVEAPKQADLPPSEQLKMEGQAGEGESPFAAGTVSRDYIGGTVGGGGGMQFAWFGNALQRHIQDELARNRKVKLGDYRVTVNVWIGADGVIRRAELAGSTGNADTDRALRAALTDLGPMRTAVPENLPQPIKLRITNRMTG
jgi:protein TonB